MPKDGDAAPGDEVLHVLRPSPARRAFGALTQAGLGAILLWIAAATPPVEPAWLVFLVVLGAGAIVLALRGWRRSEAPLILRRDGLWEEGGAAVAPLGEVEAVDRSLFTFKPSNGFLLRLRRPLGAAWAPGMWWRLGRRVGIGGVISGADSKIAADILSTLLAERDRR
jgi:hypothetical protein